MIIQNGEYRCNSSNNDKIFKKLNGLDKKINGIKNKDKSNLPKKEKK